jgi:hypothetical protein
MFKYLAGVATGWIAARSLPPFKESPLKPPTYEELGVLMNRTKELTTYISDILDESAKNSKTNHGDPDSE